MMPKYKDIVCYFMLTYFTLFLVSIAQAIPEWVSQEGIRAGYLYVQHDPSNFSVLKDIGLNSVILKEWRFKKDMSIQDVYDWNISKRGSLAQWGSYLEQNDIHLLLAFNWGSHPSYPYRRAVFDDGAKDTAPCPRDLFLWKTHLPAIVQGAFDNAARHHYTIDGIWLDAELYFASDAKKNYYKNYKGNKCCFCDNCFSSFFLLQGIEGENFPPAAPKDRYRWLKEHNQFEAYRKFLSVEVETLAEEFAAAVRRDKDDLLIGLYPSVFIEEDYSDWFLLAIARGLGSQEQPVLIFETTTYGYYGRKGHTRIPDNPEAVYTRAGVDGKFVAGYLLRRFSPHEIEENLYYALRKGSGYWMFRLPTLWGEAGMEKDLYSGNPDDYLKAIKRANTKIDSEKRSTDRPK